MMQVLIAGFHRSGTSLLTHLLHESGLFIGDELLGAEPYNPYGHFEDRVFLELHREILLNHGDDWQWEDSQNFYISSSQWAKMSEIATRRNILHEKWGFKDPRVCFFMGAWKYLMPDAKAVIVYRDPADSVRSLESRHARELFRNSYVAERNRRFFERPDHGLKLWNNYNRALVAYARGHLEDVLVIPFEHLSTGMPVMSYVNHRLGANLRSTPTSSVFDASVTSARDFPQRVFSSKVKTEIEETWRGLESLHAETCPCATGYARDSGMTTA